MASTSSTRMAVERDAVSQSMSLLLESMNEEIRAQLDRWIPEIEDHAVRSIAELPSTRILRRRPEILAAAALYQAFLEFESRTRLAVRTPFLSETLGLTLCSVNQAYRRLFDRRVSVRTQMVKCVSRPSDDLSDLVVEVSVNLQNALERQSPETDQWFAEVERDAMSMANALTDSQRATYENDVIAAAAVYGATQRQPTQPIVHMAQKDIALTCRFSPAMLSKVWLELFCEGSISSIIDTGVRGK
jgi:hypothetical protein